jgi:hypothetical protein
MNKELYYVSNGARRLGNHSFLVGAYELYGDCSQLVGDASGLSGNCTHWYGDCTGVIGDLDSIKLIRPNLKRNVASNIHVVDVEV